MVGALSYFSGGAAEFGSPALCRRSDSLAIAIVIPPASTARPAIWPPRRRASSGTSAAVVFACKDLAPGRLADPVPVPGEAPTVGNRSDGFVGETLVPAIGVSEPAGAGLLGVVIGEGDGLGAVAVITSVAVPEYELAGESPVTDAESCHCKPTVAVAGTSTMASSSSAWLTGMLPSVQVVPFDAGQTRKAGGPRPVAFSTFVVTTTPELAACVLHTQMTKLAKLPGAT